MIKDQPYIINFRTVRLPSVPSMRSCTARYIIYSCCMSALLPACSCADQMR
jgi:hypothetical protein